MIVGLTGPWVRSASWVFGLLEGRQSFPQPWASSTNTACTPPPGQQAPRARPSIRFHLLSLSEPVHYSFIILVLLLIIINNHPRQAGVLTAPPLSILSVCFNPACLSGINLIFSPI